ncbi:MAG: hypothetical protein M3295_05405, partial [Chloroflexota bacterium]|nr:hypothetical protein [Chloroflexota bacterium]
MPESVTESFCERCGTRYGFSSPAKLDPLRKTRGLASGLKRYLTSQDSLANSFADALQEESESLSDRQMEAYHRVFAFCIECRQYACREKCWNDRVGRCLSCAPMVVPGEGVESWPGQDLLQPILSAQTEQAERRLRGDEAWPNAEFVPWTATDDIGPATVASEEADVHAETPLDLAVVAAADVNAAVAAETAPEAVPEADVAETADTELPQPVILVPAEETAPEPVPDRELEPITAADDGADDRAHADPRVTLVWTAPVGDAGAATRTDEERDGEPVAAVADDAAEPEPPTDATEAAEPAFPELPPERIAAIVDTPEAVARRAQLETLGLPDPARQAPAPVAPPSVLPYRPFRTRELAANSAVWD